MSGIRLVIRFCFLMILSIALSCSSIIDVDGYRFTDKNVTEDAGQVTVSDTAPQAPVVEQKAVPLAPLVEQKTSPRAPVAEQKTVLPAPFVLEETAPGEIIAEKETAGEQEVSASLETAPDAAEDAQEQNETFTVKLVAKELTWIRITVDDKEPFEVMLRAGESYRKAAGSSMKLRIGNGGGLSLFFNDIPLGAPGEHGKPLNLQFPEAVQGF